MTIGFLYWLVLLLTLLFGLSLGWPRDPANRYLFGSSLLVWVLFLLLGLGVFGFPIRAG